MLRESGRTSVNLANAHRDSEQLGHIWQQDTWGCGVQKLATPEGSGTPSSAGNLAARKGDATTIELSPATGVCKLIKPGTAVVATRSQRPCGCWRQCAGRQSHG